MLSKTMPVSVSRRLLEEYNKEFNNNSSNSNSNQEQTFPPSPMSYYSSSSRSSSPEPTFDSIVSGHSLHRQPTFSYIPIHKRRRSTQTLSRSMSFNSSLSMSIPNQQSSLSSSSSIQTPESEIPTTPISLCSSNSDQSVEYTSFPNLEKFADECWTEIRIEKRDNSICDMEMESYDEMLVAGVRFQYF